MSFTNKLLTIALLVFFGNIQAEHQSVPIKDVSVLTLSAGRFTTGRRSSPVPQLSCVGGFCEFSPTTVRCTNDGWDGTDVNWSCRADLDNRVKFGRLNVQCEGYEYPDDPNILKGSCGLEYTLDNTNIYKKVYNEKVYNDNTQLSGAGDIAVVAIFFAAWILVCMCMNSVDYHYHDHGYGGYGRGYGYRSSGYTEGLVTGAVLGNSWGRSGSSWGSSGWSRGSGSGWSGGSSSRTGFATTSRR